MSRPTDSTDSRLSTPAGTSEAHHRVQLAPEQDWTQASPQAGDVPTVTLAGLRFQARSPEGATTWLVKRALSKVPGDVHYINAYTVALTASDVRLMNCLQAATANFCDGKPLSKLSSRFGGSDVPQVRGPQAFADVLDQGRQIGLRHYFLGSTPATLVSLRQRVEALYPGIVIVGMESPPFGGQDEESVAAQDAEIRAANPHIVWVGLGTPKQDFEAERLASEGFFACAVGAAFDFLAGTKKEAPPWLSEHGLEWSYRLATEPRRLWKRYLIGNPVFLWTLWRRR